MSADVPKKAKREYRPEVEGLEALRLFHAAVPSLPGVVADHAGDLAAGASTWPIGVSLASDTLAWDTVLEGTVADLIGPGEISVSDPVSLKSGLGQLDRYLGRAWARAAVPESKRDDCTQAVYVSMIESMGRPAFDRMLTDIGRYGVKDVLNKESAQGPDFFRAVDAVKKRAQRERTFTSMDESRLEPPARSGSDDWSRSLHEGITRVLTPREAELIQSTLAGDSPSDIADRWGVAAKTVSNEKTRALSKLREFLTSDSASLN